MIAAIVGMTKDRVIGKNNDLPWRIAEDLKHFKQLTSGHPILMGRNTYESIGRPLPKRTNIVVSRTMQEIEGIVVKRSFEEALEYAQTLDEDVFVIGGARLYEYALPFLDTLCISWIHGDYDGDTYFPEVDFSQWTERDVVEHEEFTYVRYERIDF